MLRRSWTATDPGRVQTDNEDCSYASDELGLYAVMDGVGGPAGEFASRMAAQLLKDEAPTLRLQVEACLTDPDAGRRKVFDLVHALLEKIANEIYGLSQSDPNLQGAATTLTLALLGGDGAFLAHVGDSRCYVLREDSIQRLTEDHTLAQELLRSGRLKPDETSGFRYRNVVARTLGDKPSVEADLGYVDVAPGDLLVLCTDGVSDYLTEPGLQRALADAGLHKPAQRLVDLALRAGGSDNATAVVVQFAPADDAIRATTTRPLSPNALGPAVKDAPFLHTLKLEMLGHLFFCQHLTQDERLKVLRYVHEVQKLAGEPIVRQGDEGQDLFLVVQGSVDVWVDGAQVTTLGPGAHFGEIALVSGQRRTATVVAREPVRLFRLSRDDFFHLSQRDQAVAVKMLWAFSQTLASRVTDLSQKLASRSKATG